MENSRYLEDGVWKGVWTTEEEEFLIANYSIKGRKYCIESLNRHVNSVRKKVEKLGLVSFKVDNLLIKKKPEIEKYIDGADLSDVLFLSSTIIHLKCPDCKNKWSIQAKQLYETKYICKHCRDKEIEEIKTSKKEELIKNKIKTLKLVEFEGDIVDKKTISEKLNIPIKSINLKLKQGYTIEEISKCYSKQYYCIECKTEDVENFYPKNRRRCKKCIISNSKNRNNYHELGDEEKAKLKDRTNKWVDSNIFRVRFLAARIRAKKNNLDFDIDEDFLKEIYISQNKRCFYSGVELHLKRSKFYSVSIDRIDSSLGYVKNNVVLTCDIINRMKNELSKEEFLSIIRNIYNFNKL